MIKLSFLELIIRGTPEEAIYMWACYILTKTKFELKRYLLSTTLLVLVTYLIRSLPISMGINVVLFLGVLILTNINVNKISIIKSISVSVSVIILESICEFINMLIIRYLFKADLTKVWSNPFLKTIYGIPSLVLFVILIIIITAVFNKSKKEDIQL
ncbi:hypothetical protein [Clostridium lacusfryxellense]|uniref:hypothetical protein n=1 Tax=Clostridium lacusfryxellense TaxID=205328 RepID=UPI001C0D2AAF|nr:hypothetical protein [Clostridium lacusfryxellense]MBU3110345.1 hypothetical protein [Clostridium lacusfryxellense]